MILLGEVRCYVGGRYELYANGDEFGLVWIPGKMMCKARYSSKDVRRQVITKMQETWGEIEIAIKPDDLDADEAIMEQKEKDLMQWPEKKE